ncbi:MAG: molybdenum cofactor biosynthesis protein MoaE [Verrucomicrobia bacterium]|nr:molybdenum cofactor biosynthesis protein MoaE [Verrucomicrobiota bacterium]
MKASLEITEAPIELGIGSDGGAFSGDSGAVVRFLGVVRGREGGRLISAIDYEVFPEMAKHQFDLIFNEALSRWPVQSVRVIHRIGVVPVNHPSLWIEVVGSHRGEAFAACQFVIDEMKRRVPIWKKPMFS